MERKLDKTSLFKTAYFTNLGVSVLVGPKQSTISDFVKNNTHFFNGTLPMKNDFNIVRQSISIDSYRQERFTQNLNLDSFNQEKSLNKSKTSQKYENCVNCLKNHVSIFTLKKNQSPDVHLT
ncbi:hypothetical protein BpHYR1_022397 [Brachionus plicatilis]|uniref:Uncharacterized protein n=1 Tax=Brachionus plicatilis TaxID=10195 RepID=A0A3M7RCK1_BRAPC|nr:hypothetical protein BpHYR1_022397 [Brachionus plicatilis]